MLEAEPYMYAPRSGDADAGVPQQPLAHNEFDSMLQEEGDLRVAEIMEPQNRTSARIPRLRNGRHPPWLGLRRLRCTITHL